MSQELFTDGFANIAVTGTVVRIDLMSLAGQDKDGKPTFNVHQRLVMPLDGFLRSFAMCNDVVEKLTKAGVIKRRTPAEPGPVIQASSEPGSKEPKKK